MSAINIQPLLDTLSKLSDGRVPNFSLRSNDKDLYIAEIPVTEVNTGDRKDSTLRKYAKDWIKTRLDRVHIDTFFVKLPRGTSFFTDEGKEIPVQASIKLSWRVLPKLTGMDELKKQQAEWKGTRPSSDTPI